MRESVENRRRKIRQAHLEAERRRFLAMPGRPFRLIKDWDDDPTVVWQGTIFLPSLEREYKIEIRYGPLYPFRRPRVFPCDDRIIHNRHQNPNVADPEKPGYICLFQSSVNDWVVGVTCEEIIERTRRWFEKYEAGTLGEEAAPPEIERYYPLDYQSSQPLVIVAETLTDRPNNQTFGLCYLIPTTSGKRAFLTLDSDTSWTEEITELSRVLFPADATVSEEMRVGRWFRVDKEPFPVPLTGAKLLTFIAHHNKEVTLKALCNTLIKTKLKPKLIAIRYPVTALSGRWLVYQVGIQIPPLGKGGVPDGYRSEKAYKAVLHWNRNSPLKLLPVHHVSIETLFRRVPGQTSQSLEKAKVLLLGCGTIGSRVAETLIKSGLGNLVLVDNDELKAGNVCRHVLGLDSLGRNKAKALRDVLLRRNPFAKVRALDVNVLAGHDVPFLLLRNVDLVICCIGNDAVETWVNDIAMASDKPVLFCRTYAHATIGELILAQMDQGCFECVKKYLGKPDCPIPPVPALDFTQMIGFDTDCGATFIPASAVDVDLVCLHAARLAIQLLLGKSLSANYWLVRGRPLRDDEDWTFVDELSTPFQVSEYQVDPNDTCPVCRAGHAQH